jgi:hypothetical protein
MKRLLIGAVIALCATGCQLTPAQVTAIENGFHTGVTVATNAVIAVENNEGNIDDAAAKIKALAGQSAAAQKAIADAQAALEAFKNKQGTIDEVLAALQKVDQLTAPDANKPIVARTARKKAQ